MLSAVCLTVLPFARFDVSVCTDPHRSWLFGEAADATCCKLYCCQCTYKNEGPWQGYLSLEANISLKALKSEHIIRRCAVTGKGRFAFKTFPGAEPKT